MGELSPGDRDITSALLGTLVHSIEPGSARPEVGVALGAVMGITEKGAVVAELRRLRAAVDAHAEESA